MSKPHYSGDNSRAFWKSIAKLPEPKRDQAYSLGVVLQETEATVLRLLKAIKKS